MRRGFGEPGVLNIRAAGDLTIHGSINDGFARRRPRPTIKAGTEWRNAQNNGNTPFGGDIVIPIDGVSLDKRTVFPKGAVLNYDLPAGGVTLPKGIALPVAVGLAGNYVLPAGWCWARTCTTATALGGLARRHGADGRRDARAGHEAGAGTVLRAETLAAALTCKGVACPRR